MSLPAPLAAAVLAQAAMELRLTARRGENVLAIAVIPVAVLLFFSTAGVLTVLAGRPVDLLLPGALALGLIAAGLVNLGIATAYERHYGVLKRLGATPLSRSGLIAAKLSALLVVELVQVVVLVAVAVALLDWRPGEGASIGLAVTAIGLGTMAFAGLGLLLAGTLRAEATLALANGLFIGFLMVGGIVLPVDHLPMPLDALAGLLPAAALSELFRASLATGGATDAGRAIAILGAWGIAAVALAVRTFRWD